MKNELEKIFKENPDLARGVNDIAKGMAPHIIEFLLSNGMLDKKRLSDLKYVWQTVIANLDVVDNIQVSYRIHNELMEAARDMAKLNKVSVMIILVATTIEHTLNSFYQDALQKKLNLSEKETTEILRNSIHAKLSWMLKIVSSRELSDKLRKRIKQIIELRNRFVHYKPNSHSINEPGRISEMIEKATDIGIEVILSTPSELENELSSISAEIFPEFEISKEIAKSMFTKP